MLVTVVAVPTAFTTLPDAGTLADVGKPLVYVLSPVNPENKNSKGHWILDNC